MLEKISLEDGRDFFEMAQNCKYLGCFDIKSCYHQLPIHSDFVKYLGFKWNLDGKERFFCFVVVAFGLTSGPKVCQQVFKPLITKWRADNICAIIFFDDGAYGAESLEECEKASQIILRI